MTFGIRIISLLAAVLSLTLLASAVSAAAAVEVLDDFENGLDPNWKIQKFQGVTQYTATQLAGENVLMAYSKAAAAALVYKKEYKLQDYPFLSWRWKVNAVNPLGDARVKSGDDYAARIYVVFPHWFYPKTRSINYIWANQLPKGESIPSTYTANSIMLAAQSGRDNVGRWMTERVNVLEDYRRLFGEEPPAVGAIAIMTDADDTGGEALAWYDNIQLEK